MPSVDNYNIDRHSRYAVDVASLESFKDDYQIDRLADTRSVSDHAKVLDHVPKPDAAIWLFGLNQRRRWAFFKKPESFAHNRIFLFDGTVESSEADTQKILTVDCSDQDPGEQALREKEKNILLNFSEKKTSLLEDHQQITGGRHQFIQG